MTTHEPISLVWGPTEKLEWSDFMAKPNAESKLAAELVCGLETEMLTEISSTGYGQMDFTVRAVAYPMESWNKSETDYLLAHEQLHFDIAEIYARRLRKQVSEHQFRQRSVEATLGKFIRTTLDEYNMRQRAYDSETQHSLEREKQAEWAAVVSKELQELAAFHSTDVMADIVP